MPDHTTTPPRSLMTQLSHVGRHGTKIRGFVNPAVHRGSTMLHKDMVDRAAGSGDRLKQAFAYGVEGNTTHHMLENVVAAIEGGTRCQVVSSGLAAVTTPLLAFLSAGDHCLLSDSVYGPTRSFCNGMLTRLGIEVTFFDPGIDAAGIEALFRPNTRVLYLESPGSHSFEIQDVPALSAVAHARGATVMMDNTWGVHFFQPFRHGVDVSIQALTKYVAGHSDVLLGGITVNTDKDWERLRTGALELGQYASPDDCWLALRGARTLGVRLQRQMASGIELAQWFAARPEVAQVLHPALPGAPGHEIWKRDFTGAPSLFGVVFRAEVTAAALHGMVDALTLFGIGASWGGFESLALPSGKLTRSAATAGFTGPACRFHIGLEDPADLIADLEQAFTALQG